MAAKKLKNIGVSSTFARSDDGTIQITFQIPYEIIKSEKEKVLKELSKDVDIPGFRKGNAPLEQVENKLSKNIVFEKILNNILPKELDKIITQHNLKLAVYPKLELISANENETWQIRSTTCEIPEVDTSNIKKAIESEKVPQKIWTQDTREEEKEALTQQQKDQKIIGIILENAKAVIPKILIEEEVNARLSQLLQRLEKLGLTLEGYLSSINKNAQTLREDYEKQAKDSLVLELALNKIADQENLEITGEDVDNAIKAASLNKSGEDLNEKSKRRLIESTLKRNKALKLLASYLE